MIQPSLLRFATSVALSSLVIISPFSATKWSLLALHRPPVTNLWFYEHCHKPNLDTVILSRYRSWSSGTHRRPTQSQDCVMPPSTSQVKVIYLPGIGETRVVTLPSMRDVEGHSWMTCIFTILLFFAFSLAGSELPLRYDHVHPLLWYIYLFR